MHLNKLFISGGFSCRFIIILSFALSLLSFNVSSKSDGNNPSVIQRFWEIGCEFSGVVSRVRRSAAPNPPPEEPNFDDPEELFKYLYPLADVKPGDDMGSQRSNYGTHSLSSWLEDLMELWHSECQHRRRKRSAERREESNKNKPTQRDSWSSQTHRIRGRVDRPARLVSAIGSGSGSGGKNSSLGMSLSKTINAGRKGDNYDGSEMINTYNYTGESGNFGGAGNRQDLYSYYGGPMEMDHHQYMSNSNNDNYEDGGDGYYYKNGILEEILDKEEEKFDKNKPKPDDSAPATTAAPPAAAAAPPAPPPPEKVEDIFFAQYGGDIEYFFPLLSFGIPFDGEITLLGFHGFHGLFPY